MSIGLHALKEGSMKENVLVTAVRFTRKEREWLEIEASNNGRTLSGEVRFRLRKQREHEQSQQETKQ